MTEIKLNTPNNFLVVTKAHINNTITFLLHTNIYIEIYQIQHNNNNYTTM